MRGKPKSGIMTALPWICLLPLVLWAAALLSQSFTSGAKLDALLNNLSYSFANPFDLQWTDRTAAFLLASVLLYGMGIAMYYSATVNTRPGEEHGSARWGNPKHVNAKYADNKNPYENLILTQNIRLGMDSRKHQRNLNVLVIGGSGAGKSRFYCRPNLMQTEGNSSFIICDPKGEALRTTGGLLESKDYDVKVFNLINMEQSQPLCLPPGR